MIKKIMNHQGLNAEELIELLADLKPELRHKPEDILKEMLVEKLMHVSFGARRVDPEEAIKVLSSEIPEFIDDFLSLELIMGYIKSDLENILTDLRQSLRAEPGFPELELEIARDTANFYRKTLKRMRRARKKQTLLIQLRHEAEKWESLGLGKPINTLFNPEETRQKKILELLEESNIYYDFQLLFISVDSFISNHKGLGKKSKEVLMNAHFAIVDKIGEKDVTKLLKQGNNLCSNLLI